MRNAEYVKRSYESLNGQKREGRDAIFQDVYLSDEAPLTALEIGELLYKIGSEDEVMVFFGANWCPWCRNAIMVMAEVANEDDFTVCYVDMDRKRPIYRCVEGEIVNVHKAGEDYLRLAELLDAILLPYPLKDENGNVIANPYKVLSLPLVVYFDHGAIKGYHYGAVDLKADQTPYDLLDIKQHQELADIYRNLKVSSSVGMTCDINGECK